MAKPPRAPPPRSAGERKLRELVRALGGAGKVASLTESNRMTISRLARGISAPNVVLFCALRDLAARAGIALTPDDFRAGP